MQHNWHTKIHMDSFQQSIFLGKHNARKGSLFLRLSFNGLKPKHTLEVTYLPVQQDATSFHRNPSFYLTILWLIKNIEEIFCTPQRLHLSMPFDSYDPFAFMPRKIHSVQDNETGDSLS